MNLGASMNVTDEHELYRSDPTDENFARLYEATREYAWKIGRGLFPDLDKSYYRHACENAATTVVLYFEEKFDPQKGSFSTWAFQSIRCDLIDWRQKKMRRREDSLDVLHHDQPTPVGDFPLDERLLLDGILPTLTDEEWKLCD